MKYYSYIFLIPFLYLLSCTVPVDPLYQYDNCEAVFVAVENNDVHIVDDSVDLSIALSLPHLIDSVIFSINDIDSLIICEFESKQTDTLLIKKVFSSPEELSVGFVAFMSNKSKSQLSDTKTISIVGKEPVITANPKNLFYLEPGFSCTLSVQAQGTQLRYQWSKDDQVLVNATLDTLILAYVTEAYNGEYTCRVFNDWGEATSTPASVLVKKDTDRPVYWTFGLYPDSLTAGETLSVAMESRCVVPEGTQPSFSLLESSDYAHFDNNGNFIFIADQLQYGVYLTSVIVEADGNADTAIVSMKVLSGLFTLSLNAEYGSVTVDPEQEQYRGGDAVTLTAVPANGYKFYEWQGDITGIAQEIRIVIERDMAITASFIEESAEGCRELATGSLTTAVKEASPSSERPGSLCPQEGLYDEGTIQVWGTVRFNFQ